VRGNAHKRCTRRGRFQNVTHPGIGGGGQTVPCSVFPGAAGGAGPCCRRGAWPCWQACLIESTAATRLVAKKRSQWRGEYNRPAGLLPADCVFWIIANADSLLVGYGPFSFRSWRAFPAGFPLKSRLRQGYLHAGLDPAMGPCVLTRSAARLRPPTMGPMWTSVKVQSLPPS
jgi:hypothetical protein